MVLVWPDKPGWGFEMCLDSREVRMDPTAPAFKKAVHELLAAKPLSSNLFDPTED